MTGPEEVLRASPLAGAPGLRWTPGVPTVASPMRQAVDAANWIVEADGTEPAFLKVYHPDTVEGIDLPAAWAGTSAASAMGVGPAARFFLPEHGALATAYLPPPWRSAFLHDLATPAVLEAAVAVKRALHAADPLPRRWDVFAETAALHARALSAGVDLPADTGALLAWNRGASDAVAAAGADLRPCHNDGSASSLMLGPGGRAMLVDFDCAGQADPFADLALLLNEASAFGHDWSRGVELYAGRADPRLVDRCRVYAVADDVLWGLWGWLLSATSPRRTVEFLKYGEWRLLRARMALREHDFSARLHRL